jgi:hypothetical protein
MMQEIETECWMSKKTEKLSNKMTVRFLLFSVARWLRNHQDSDLLNTAFFFWHLNKSIIDSL